jgi:mono/diheme cytochrome c family protein
MAPPRRPRRNPRRRPTHASNTRTRAVAAIIAIVMVGTFVLGAYLFGLSSSDNQPVDAATTFRQRCSGCHGVTGDGGTGPKLSGGAVARKYPNIDDQIAVVTNGRGAMPAFKGKGLTSAEIRAVVEYTRTQL